MRVCSIVSDFVTPQTVACWAPLSRGFSRQEYCSGMPFVPPAGLPDPGVEPVSSTLQVGSFLLGHLAAVKNQTEAEDSVLLKPLCLPSGRGRRSTSHLGKLLSHQIDCGGHTWVDSSQGLAGICASYSSVIHSLQVHK